MDLFPSGVLLAAARAELASPEGDAEEIARFRAAWRKTTSAYLAGRHEMSDGWTKFSPCWTEPELSGPRLAALASMLVTGENKDEQVAAGATIDEVAAEFFKNLRNQSNGEEVVRLEASGSILIDLARQRWMGVPSWSLGRPAV